MCLKIERRRDAFVQKNRFFVFGVCFNCGFCVRFKMATVSFFSFWICTASMFVLSTLNLVILLLIVSSLNLNPMLWTTGSSLTSFFQLLNTKPFASVKFAASSIAFDQILLAKFDVGRVESFRNRPLELVPGSDLRFGLGTGQSFEINETAMVFKGFDNLFLKSGRSRRHRRVNGFFNLTTIDLKTDRFEQLAADTIRTHHVRSPIDQPLRIHSDANAWLRGSEHIQLIAGRIHLAGTAAVRFRTEQPNGRIQFDCGHGLYLNSLTTKNISAVAVNDLTTTTAPYNEPSSSYKLCICKKNAKIFKIPVLNAIENCSFFAQCY